MNRSEVAELLAVVQSGDRRTVGQADVELWWEVLGDVPLTFASHAVIAHFKDYPEVWLQPGHIHQRWRAYRRDQLAREDEQMRLARQAALDAKNVEELGVAELADSIPVEPKHVRRSEQHGVNPLNVRCPWCKATVGRACWNAATKNITAPHPARVEEAHTKEDTNA